MLKNSNLRIVSGRLRGCKLLSPKTSTTHPMGSREKLALFNRLQPYLAGAKVLDAYAGSGALGLEALSRGATDITFIENNPAAFRTVHDNVLQISRCSGGAAVLNGARIAFHPEPVGALVTGPYYQDSFDIVIADPPYDHFDMHELELVANCAVEEGIFALSYPAKRPTPTFYGFTLLSDRKYAAAGIAIYQKNL